MQNVQIKLNLLLKVYTAISRKVVGKNVQATIPKGSMGYGQYTIPETIAVEATFVAFLLLLRTNIYALSPNCFTFL